MQIIGIGLCGVFELIKETRFSHPSLCLRSLQALLDMLQGQQPEGFQTEPPDVLGKADIIWCTCLNRVVKLNAPWLVQRILYKVAFFFSFRISFSVVVGDHRTEHRPKRPNGTGHHCPVLRLPLQPGGSLGRHRQNPTGSFCNPHQQWQPRMPDNTGKIASLMKRLLLIVYDKEPRMQHNTVFLMPSSKTA